jgi:hypothetical protein
MSTSAPRMSGNAAVAHLATAALSSGNPEWDQAAREFGMTGVDEMAAAAAPQPGETLMLRSDRLTPVELADEVLAEAGLRQAHAGGKRMRQKD